MNSVPGPSAAGFGFPGVGGSSVRLAFAVLGGLTATLLTSAQPASLVEIKGESLTLSYSYHHFDGVIVDTVVLTARPLQLVTDTLGAWTPHGDGTTRDGFVLKHQKLKQVFVTLSPFVGPGPGKTADDWRSYRWEVAAHLGADTQIQDVGESGTPGGVPSFGSWSTREALFETPKPSGGLLVQRHVVATDRSRGIVFILAGPAAEVAAAEQDFRFLLARLESKGPVRTAVKD